MRRVALLASVAVAGATLAAGCGTIHNAAAPICSPRHNDVLVLMAQSVPTADRIPCIASYPAGWNLATVRIRSGQASFTLNSDRGGAGALRVTLEATCDVVGATQETTDKLGTVRYERIQSVDSGFRAARSYRFPGGCVTYRFHFKQRGQALVNEASVVIAFLTRAELDSRVRSQSDGHLHL